jgi:hypothetical protein
MPTPPHKSRPTGLRLSQTKQAFHAQAMVHPSILLGLLAITGGILSLAPPGVTVLALDLRSRDDHAPQPLAARPMGRRLLRGAGHADRAAAATGY